MYIFSIDAVLDPENPIRVGKHLLFACTGLLCVLVVDYNVHELRFLLLFSLPQESKRSESLMDIHHKRLKTKAAEDKNRHQERTPFDRDKDLKVNRFDEAQKKALIKKSRELNTRFSHGKGNMFL